MARAPLFRDGDAVDASSDFGESSSSPIRKPRLPTMAISGGRSQPAERVPEPDSVDPFLFAYFSCFRDGFAKLRLSRHPLEHRLFGNSSRGRSFSVGASFSQLLKNHFTAPVEFHEAAYSVGRLTSIFLLGRASTRPGAGEESSERRKEGGAVSLCNENLSQYPALCRIVLRLRC